MWRTGSGAKETIPFFHNSSFFCPSCLCWLPVKDDWTWAGWTSTFSHLSLTFLALQQKHVQHQSLLNLNPICLEISVSHQATDINFKQTPLCFIWPSLMGSYLVFSAYLFLLCGLRVMCLPNLIISDPDFHLHVGGLLNPIPGKLFSISPVCVPFWRAPLCSEAYRRLSLPLTWMLNAQMYLDKYTIVHTVKGCTYTNMHKFKHMKEHTPFSFLSSCLCSSVFLLSFILIHCAHFSSTLNPLFL